MKKFIIISLCLIAINFGTSFAQVLDEDVNITIYPSDPKPGQSFSAQVQSFGLDVSNTNISWYYNNKLVASGFGKSSVNLNAPNSGQSTLLVTVSGPDGNISTSIVIRPGSLDIIWEATDSYVPPFYKGKALAPSGGKIKVVAIPSALAPKTLSYSWSYNDSAVPNQSGVNKNSLLVKSDILKDKETFSVLANSGSFSAKAQTTIVPRTPDLLAYQRKNGFINYQKGYTNDISIEGEGTIIRVEPYNFSVAKSPESSLGINFNLGEETFSGIDNAQEVAISKPENGGTGSLKIDISSLFERFQLAKRTFTLRF